MAGPFKIGDILPEENPCGYIDVTVPFLFPQKSILNNSLIADFNSSFHGEPPFAGDESRARYVRAANDRGIQMCRKKTLFLPGEPLVGRIKALTCRQKTKTRVRLCVNEFALFTLFDTVEHTWDQCLISFDWDKRLEPEVNLMLKPGWQQLFPAGHEGFGTIEDFRIRIDPLTEQWIYFSMSWRAPRSNAVFSGQSQALCNVFSDDSWEDDIPTGDPRIKNFDFGVPLYQYIGSNHSLLLNLTSPYSDAVFGPIPGLGNDGDIFNSLPWKDFYHAKTFDPHETPIVTWVIKAQAWALGPSDDDPEA